MRLEQVVSLTFRILHHPASSFRIGDRFPVERGTGYIEGWTQDLARIDFVTDRDDAGRSDQPTHRGYAVGERQPQLSAERVAGVALTGTEVGVHFGETGNQKLPPTVDLNRALGDNHLVARPQCLDGTVSDNHRISFEDPLPIHRQHTDSGNRIGRRRRYGAGASPQNRRDRQDRTEEWGHCSLSCRGNRPYAGRS